MTYTAESPLVIRLKKKESLRLNVYIDTTGNITIGWGHNLGKLILLSGVKLSQVRLQPVNGITLEMAETLLLMDVAAAYAPVSRLPWADTMDDVRRDVLVELVFNIGPTVLTYPKFVAQLKTHDYRVAANNMRTWDWYQQVHAARAEPLCRMLSSGVRE